MDRNLDALEAWTRAFAVAVIRICARLERSPGLRAPCAQLARAAGNVGSNHRAMRRARSTREFAAKLQIVNEEVDESTHWLDVLAELAPDLCPDPQPDLKPLLTESRELRSIFARARDTTRRRLTEGG